MTPTMLPDGTLVVPISDETPSEPELPEIDEENESEEEDSDDDDDVKTPSAVSYGNHQRRLAAKKSKRQQQQQQRELDLVSKMGTVSSGRSFSQKFKVRRFFVIVFKETRHPICLNFHQLERAMG